MEKEKEGEKIKEWFNRFDEKLKPQRDKHIQMELIKSEILDNQRILSEYKMDEQNKVRKKIKKGNVSLSKDIDKVKNMLIKEVETLAYNQLNNKNHKDLNNSFANEIIIDYKIDTNKNNIRLFGKEFCGKNKNKCTIIINNKKKELII